MTAVGADFRPPATSRCRKKSHVSNVAKSVWVSEKEPFGQYLVDDEGKSLYMLETDTQATGSTEAVSVCSGECVEEWPLLTTTGEPEAGDGVDASMLGTIARDDGTMQVTYSGWPLYYYHDDQTSGGTGGQDVHDDWGGWYLLAPSGEPIEGARLSVDRQSTSTPVCFAFISGSTWMVIVLSSISFFSASSIRSQMS